MFDISFALGIIFFAAIIGGRISKRLHVPKVTGYIIVGLLVGPSVFNWIDQSHINNLHILSQVAMALVLFIIGGNFKLSKFRRIGRKIIPIAFWEITFTFLAVLIGLWSFSGKWDLALILGSLAIATAPITTIMVLKEYDSEGPISDNLTILLGINNAASIILFEMSLLFVHLMKNMASVSLSYQASQIVWDIIGAFLFGTIFGLAVSYLNQKISGKEKIVFFLAVVMGIIGLSNYSHVPYMLTFLVMGIVVANSSEFLQEIIKEMERIGNPIYVAFFVVAGSSLHVDHLMQIGLLGIGYVIFRGIGKYVGAYYGARRANSSSQIKNLIGLGLFSQAGVAVGLAMILFERDQSLGAPVLTVILSSVIVFEIIGPILVKSIIVKGGEVKITNLIGYTSPRPPLGIMAVVDSVRESLGLESWRSEVSIESIQVMHAMRKNVKSLNVRANFSEILKFIEYSDYNTFPLVNDNNLFEGVISFQEIRDLVYDESLTQLIIAKDFARHKDMFVLPDDSMEVALQTFENNKVDCLPVVDSMEEKTLVGMLEQKDVVKIIMQKRLQNESP